MQQKQAGFYWDQSKKTEVLAKESLFSKYFQIVVVVACYWVVSISLVFINKHLLSSKEFKIDAPLFITCFQCIIAIALCVVLSWLSRLVPSLFSFPVLYVDVAVMKQILPLSLVFVAMITFNNLCLKYVGVAFYYVGRSLTTVFNVVLTYFLLHQSTSAKAFFCCFIIVFGFCLGVDQEGNSGSLSMLGVVFGILASLSVSLYSIYIKKVLPVVKESIWLLTFFNNLNAVILFLPMMLLTGEFQVIYNYPNIHDCYFWLLMIVGGVFGFAIGYVTGLQIKVTSPLTHNISGTAKACAQTVIAVAWYQEIKSVLWWNSNMLVLLGSAIYTRVRQLEMKAHHELQEVREAESEEESV